MADDGQHGKVLHREFVGMLFALVIARRWPFGLPTS